MLDEQLPLSAWVGTFLALLAAGGLVLFVGLSSSPTELGLVGFLVALWMVRIVVGVAQPNGRELRLAAAAGFVGFHVHLLAAGGIGQPGAMLAAWALAAAAVPCESIRFPQLAHWAASIGLATIVGIAAILDAPGTAIRSVRRDLVGLQIRSVESTGIPASGPRRERLSQLYRQAAEILPEDVQVWRQQALWYARLMADDGGPAAFQAAEAAYGEALRLAPRSAGLWRERSATALAWAGQDVQALPLAVQYAKAATAWYPNSAAVQWEAAYANSMSGPRTTAMEVRQRLDDMRRLRPAIRAEIGAAYGARQRDASAPEARREARAFAARALELDAATPHFDKKLSHGERGWAQTLVQASE